MNGRFFVTNMIDTEKTVIAIPGGELEDRVLERFRQAGLNPSRPNPRSLFLDTSGPYTLVLWRANSIPDLLGRPSIVVAGIAGSDSFLEETGELNPGVEVPLYNANEVSPTLTFAITEEFAQRRRTPSLQDLSGEMVATKFPKTARRELDNRGVKPASIYPLPGKIEAATLIFPCPAIFDVVFSGRTMKANGLVPIVCAHEVTGRLVRAGNFKYMSNRHKRNLESLERIMAT
jgi:ATP phosphoribosyltransferase